jgi:hypothetical protein
MSAPFDLADLVLAQRVAPANDTAPLSLMEMLRSFVRTAPPVAGDPDVEGALREVRAAP